MHRATPAQLTAMDTLIGKALFDGVNYSYRLIDTCIYISFKVPMLTIPGMCRHRYLIRHDGAIDQLPSKILEVRP